MAKGNTAAARRSLTEGWGLVPVEVRCLRAFWNDVYRVRDDRGQRYLLRAHSRVYHDVETVSSELLWMRALARDGHAVAEPVATVRGEMVHIQDGRAHSLLPFVEGRRLSRIGVGRMTEVGRLLRGLHNHARSFRAPAGFRRPSFDAGSLARYWFHPHDDRGWRGLACGVRDRFERVFDQARKLDGQLESTLIHADVHRGNLIHTERGLTPIDFDDCLYGPLAYDAAVVLESSGATTDSVLGQALLAGYGELPDREQLDLLIALRAVGVTLFIRGFAHEDPSFRARGERRVAETMSHLALLRAG